MYQRASLDEKEEEEEETLVTARVPRRTGGRPTNGGGGRDGEFAKFRDSRAVLSIRQVCANKNLLWRMDNVADKSTKFNKSTFLISFSIFFSLSYFFALSFLIVYIYYSLYPISTFTYILLRFILPVHLCIPLSISRLCNNIYPSLRLLDTMLLIFFFFHQFPIDPLGA